MQYLDSDSAEFYGLEIKPIKGKLPDYDRQKQTKKKRRKSRSLRDRRRKQLQV